MRNWSLWSDVVFWERSNFPRIWFQDLKFRIWSLEINHQKVNLVWQRCFVFHYYLATSTTNWALMFTGLLFYAYVETQSEKTGLWQLPIVSSVFIDWFPVEINLSSLRTQALENFKVYQCCTSLYNERGACLKLKKINRFRNSFRDWFFSTNLMFMEKFNLL